MKIMRYLALITLLFSLSITVFSQKLIIDSSFNTTVNGEIEIIEILGNGKILIAGKFTLVNGVQRNRIARLNADGTLDESFNANASSGVITSMQVLTDGKILLGGGFGNGSPLEFFKAVIRLNADGSFDNTLTSIPQLRSSPSWNVKAAQLSSGKILICGDFALPNNNPKPWLARYNFNGTYDSSFTNSINNECLDVAVQTDGKYLVAGYYNTVNGSPSVSLVRFNADDTIDTSFNAQPIATSDGSSTWYQKIKLQSDGTIIAFRGFSIYRRATRFNPDGSINVELPGRIAKIGDVAFQSNGKVIVTAEYATDNVIGLSDDLNRYNTDGTHDPSLNKIALTGGNDGYAKSVAFTADGKVIAGGDFTQIYTNFGSGNPPVSKSFLVRFAPEAIPFKPKYDFDGDGKDDITVYRPSDRIWYLNRSTAGFYATQFGLSTDIPVVADYDGDRRADIAVFRDGVWYWLRSSDSVFSFRVSGQAGDIPQPNYGDPVSFVVFRPSDAKFYVTQPFGNPQVVQFEGMTLLPTDKPVIADYDGDGRTDLAVYRGGGNWYVRTSSGAQLRHYQFGLATDKPVIGDFDGDGRNDYAVYRPSNGVWYIQKSTEGFYAVQWGAANDLPVPADYDGDGKTDIAVYRDGVWWQLLSTGSNRVEQFGLPNDIPAQLR